MTRTRRARTLTVSLGAVYGQDEIYPVANRTCDTGDRTQIEFQDQYLFIGTIRSTFTFCECPPRSHVAFLAGSKPLLLIQ
jgi:hypothetical protein